MQSEPDHQHDREGKLAGSCRTADGQALGEVVQPDGGGDGQRETGRRVHGRSRGLQRRRPRSTSGCGPSIQSGIHPHQPEVPDAEGDGQHRAVAHGTRRLMLFQSLVGGIPPVAQDVPQQEQQDPGRHCGEPRLDAQRRCPQPADGQPQKNGQSRYRAERGDSGGGHQRHSSAVRASGPLRTA